MKLNNKNVFELCRIVIDYDETAKSKDDELYASGQKAAFVLCPHSFFFFFKFKNNCVESKGENKKAPIIRRMISSCYEKRAFL